MVSEPGLLHRAWYRPNSRPPSTDATYATHMPRTSKIGGSYSNPRPPSGPRIVSSPYIAPIDDASESSGSEFEPWLFSCGGSVTVQASHPSNHRSNDSTLQSFASESTKEPRQHASSLASSTNTLPLTSGTPLTEKGFVGTPHYLAPETILGLRGDDAAVDWVCLPILLHDSASFINLEHILVGFGGHHLRVSLWYPSFPRCCSGKGV